MVVKMGFPQSQRKKSKRNRKKNNNQKKQDLISNSVEQHNDTSVVSETLPVYLPFAPDCLPIAPNQVVFNKNQTGLKCLTCKVFFWR